MNVVNRNRKRYFCSAKMKSGYLDTFSGLKHNLQNNEEAWDTIVLIYALYVLLD